MSKKSKGKILVVDDFPTNVYLLRDLLEINGFEVITAFSGKEALKLLSAFKAEVILLDIMMPDMDGYEVLDKIKTDETLESIPVIMVSAKTAEKDVKLALDKGAIDYIKKPINDVELLARVNTSLRIKGLQDDLKNQNEELRKQNIKLENSEQLIMSLVEAIEVKSPYLKGHSKNVSSIAVQIAEFIGLPSKEIQVLKQSAILHDIGKIGISDIILNKNGKLTFDEYEEVKKHPEKGEIILNHVEKFQNIKKIVRSHHEKLDGTGYPDGIKSNEINLLTRIISVADVYDAVTSDRPYRKGLSSEKAIQILLEEVEKGWWDGKIVDALVYILSDQEEIKVKEECHSEV